MALLARNEPKDEAMIEGARKFVAGQQATGMAKPELDGGFGYGPTGTSPKRQHPDLDNTLISLEALRAYANARPTKESEPLFCQSLRPGKEDAVKHSSQLVESLVPPCEILVRSVRLHEPLTASLRPHPALLPELLELCA